MQVRCSRSHSLSASSASLVFAVWGQCSVGDHRVRSLLLSDLATNPPVWNSSEPLASAVFACQWVLSSAGNVYIRRL